MQSFAVHHCLLLENPSIHVPRSASICDTPFSNDPQCIVWTQAKTQFADTLKKILTHDDGKDMSAEIKELTPSAFAVAKGKATITAEGGHVPTCRLGLQGASMRLHSKLSQQA